MRHNLILMSRSLLAQPLQLLRPALRIHVDDAELASRSAINRLHHLYLDPSVSLHHASPHVALQVEVARLAKQAITRKCGARGLRAIIEDAMLDTMFELPGQTEINECVITKESVTGGKPKLIAGVRNRRSAKRTDGRQRSGDEKEIG